MSSRGAPVPTRSTRPSRLLDCASAPLRTSSTSFARSASVRPGWSTPSDLLSDDQLDAVGFWEVVEHPVAGRFKTTGMPFTFAGRARKWIRTPAPTYGEHTEDVLVGAAGQVRRRGRSSLTAIGAVSDRPAGL